MIIFVCGIHCSGKTSILQHLEENKYISYRGHEIGKELYYERKFQPNLQNMDFELEVAQREFERDIKLMNHDGVVAIETWHPGNLAYAYVRNPDSANNLIDIAKKSPLLSFAKGLWLKMDHTEINKRSVTFKNDTNWAVDFYKKIDLEIEKSLKCLNLLDNTTILNANGTFSDTLQNVTSWLNSCQGRSTGW